MNETIATTVAASAVTQPEVTFSVLQYLPAGNFTDILVTINAHMSEAAQSFVPHKWFLLPLIYDPLATMVVMVIISLIFALFLDFLRHAWKIPFAIIVDVLDVMAISVPFFNILAALGSLVIFSIFARRCSRFWKYGFIIFGVGKAFTPGLAMLPLNTIMMFIATVVDRN